MTLSTFYNIIIHLLTSLQAIQIVSNILGILNIKYDKSKKIADEKVALTQYHEYARIYKNLFIYTYLHFATIYGIYLSFSSTQWTTLLFSYFTYICANIGVTAGAHRLWSHRSFKAKRPLQIILMIFLSMANQNAIDWVRDHRLHHKYTDTDADPNNIKRGLFFSHIGWLFVKKHPEVAEKEKFIDLTDLYKNQVLTFQAKYNFLLSAMFCFIVPCAIPVVFWNESFGNSWYSVIMRYTFNLHTFFLVNSAAHYFGFKTYDKNISATEHKAVSFATFGEGFHNYHHVFPADYRNSELGNNFFNFAKLFIDFFAFFGWAYDLKTVRKTVVMKKIVKNS